MGASGDIGIACAKRIAEVGFIPLLHYCHTETPVLQLKQELEIKHNPIHICQADITDNNQVDRMIKDSVSKYHRLDALIVTVGHGFEPADWLHVDPQTFNKTVDVNLTGVFNCIRAAAAVMIKQSFGSIVSIGSTAGITGSDNIAYAAAKAGLINLTRSFAHALAPHHVTINTISPTWTNTKWHNRKSIDIQKQINSMIPMGRMIEPAEVAEAVAFFINPRNRMVTGQNLVIDGGLNSG